MAREESHQLHGSTYVLCNKRYKKWNKIKKKECLHYFPHRHTRQSLRKLDLEREGGLGWVGEGGGGEKSIKWEWRAVETRNCNDTAENVNKTSLTHRLKDGVRSESHSFRRNRRVVRQRLGWKWKWDRSTRERRDRYSCPATGCGNFGKK